jgi:hypothetical protein
MTRRLSVLALLAACLSAAPAHAEPTPEPAIKIKTRAAEISVAIDAKLNAYPGLATDLLAEGRRYADKARAESDAEFSSNPRDFREGRRWTYERSYSFRSLAGGRYVSVLRDDGTYTGGAHPNSYVNTILWDISVRRRISVRPFFRETADNGPTMTALAKLVRRAVAVQKMARWKDAAPDDEKKEPRPTPDQFAETDDGITRGVQPKLLGIGPISLAPSTAPGKSSGLTFHFSPYAVDAYAAGPYTVFVLWTALRPHLSAEGAAIFGGERPKDDETEN